MAKKPIWVVRWYDPLAYAAFMLLPLGWASWLLPYAGRWQYRNDHAVPTYHNQPE